MKRLCWSPRLTFFARADPLPLPVVLLPGQEAASDWLVYDGRQERIFLPKPVLRVSSIVMAQNALRSGAGAALLPSLMVESDLRSGKLILLGKSPDRAIEVWILHTSRRLRSPKVAAFVDFMCASFSRE